MIFLVILFNCSYSDHTKNLLVECAASHLKHNKFTASYGARLTSSSGRILLQSVPGLSLTLSNFQDYCLSIIFLIRRRYIIFLQALNFTVRD